MPSALRKPLGLLHGGDRKGPARSLKKRVRISSSHLETFEPVRSKVRGDEKSSLSLAGKGCGGGGEVVKGRATGWRCDGQCRRKNLPRSFMVSPSELDNYLCGFDLGLRSGVHPNELSAVQGYPRNKLLKSLCQFRHAEKQLVQLSDEALRRLLFAEYKKDIRDAKKLTRARVAVELKARGVLPDVSIRKNYTRLRQILISECRCGSDGGDLVVRPATKPSAGQTGKLAPVEREHKVSSHAVILPRA